jgi:hypothetical protein
MPRLAGVRSILTDEASTIQPHDDERVEQVEANGGDNEKVHGGDVWSMITQEGASSLTWWSTPLHHVLVYGPAVRCKPDVTIWR